MTRLNNTYIRSVKDYQAIDRFTGSDFKQFYGIGEANIRYMPLVPFPGQESSAPWTNNIATPSSQVTKNQYTGSTLVYYQYMVPLPSMVTYHSVKYYLNIESFNVMVTNADSDDKIDIVNMHAIDLSDPSNTDKEGALWSVTQDATSAGVHTFTESGAARKVSISDNMAMYFVVRVSGNASATDFTWIPLPTVGYFYEVA
jgi:hypothetical protein